jgi:osmotically-inducible protein OsmY
MYERQSRLGARLGHIAESLEVSVSDGEVMLDGDLESGNQKTIVDATVDDLAGVRSVVNHIRIVSPSKLAMRTLYR